MHDVRLQLANQILLFLYSLKGIIVLALERGEVVWGAEKEGYRFKLVFLV